MLKYNVRGENIEVTDALKSYVEKRLEKLEKYFEIESDVIAHVNLKVYSEKSSKVEVTIPLPYLVLLMICIRVLTLCQKSWNVKSENTRRELIARVVNVE